MKTIFLIFILFSLRTSAEVGVSTQIDPSAIKDVQAWVANAKISLETGLQNVLKTGLPDQEKKLRTLVDNVLSSSANKNNESAMRNILARVIVVHDILLNTPSSPKRDALSRRILKDGITWALEMYQPDVTALKDYKDKQKVFVNIDFNQIGLDWMQYSLNLFYQLPTNESREKFVSAVLGIAYNDMANDDKVKQALAPVMNYIFQETEKEKTSHDNLLKKSRDLSAVLETAYKQSVEILKPLYARNTSNFIYNQLNVFLQKDLPMFDNPTYEHKRGHDCDDYFCVGENIYIMTEEFKIVGTSTLKARLFTLRLFDPGINFKAYPCVRLLNNQPNTCLTDYFGIENGSYKHVTVGDEVAFVDYRGIAPVKVLAMNPKMGVFTLAQGETRIGSDAFTQAEDMWVRHGCWQGVCVGMRVGHLFIVGINPLSKTQPILIATSDALNLENVLNHIEKEARFVTLEEAKQYIY